MIYVTGDTHGNFSRVDDFEYEKGDMLIVVGDAGINYTLDYDDYLLKRNLNRDGIIYFCVRGNHEERPENISSYKEVDMFGGKVFVEDAFPNLVFAKDGEEYNIDGKSILVIGGAYSVDKKYRVSNGLMWFKDELLTSEEMDKIYDKVKGKHYDIVLSHTCPYKYEPREVFLSWIDQSKVDKSMEHFLDRVEESIDYDKWYCGHFHTEKEIDKLEFLYKGIKLLNKKDYTLEKKQ